jgi:hypothetical protein
MKKKNDEKTQGFRPKDVKGATGLSYRQLHHWQTKGAASADREDERGWRNYSLREVFVIMIAQAFRDEFGVPLERLSWMRDFMLQEPANHFKYVYETATKRGMTVFLLTDLKETFVIGTDIDIAEQFELGYFRHAEDDAAVFILKLNPILNRLLERMKQPALPLGQNGYDVFHKGKRMYTAQTLEEISLLSIARMKGIDSFTVRMKNDEPDRAVIEIEEEPSADVLAVLNDSPFQKVTITNKDGRTRTLKREISVDLPKNVDDSGRRIPLVIKVTK